MRGLVFDFGVLGAPLFSFLLPFLYHFVLGNGDPTLLHLYSQSPDTGSTTSVVIAVSILDYSGALKAPYGLADLAWLEFIFISAAFSLSLFS